MSALVLHVGAARAAWWRDTLQSLLPELDVHLWNDVPDPGAVEVAVVWRHPAGGLLRFPNLKAIVSIGAGVDHVLVDPDLPKDVPIIRTTGDDLTRRMREYVCLHVLRLHRRYPEVAAAQKDREWLQLVTPVAPARRVGVMGLGNLGSACAEALAVLGFDVAGWSQRPKEIAGVESYAGPDQQKPFLERTEILVNLLPLTPQTESILNRALFAALPEGACLINCARGEHLVEEDLIPALDAGHLSRAVLDVFHTEPLPKDHAFWDHPKIDITPHTASLIDPGVGAELIAANVKRFRAGEPVPDLVDLSQGY